MVGWLYRADLTDRTVPEAGDQSLWEPVERAYQLWHETGSRGWERPGMTVDRNGRNRVWLDHPRGQHTWELDS